jgi:hypothetical protein
MLPRMPSLRPDEIANAKAVVSDLFPDLTAGINALPWADSDEARVDQIEKRFGFLADWVLSLHGLNTEATSRAALLHHVDRASTDASWFLKRAAQGDYTPDKNAERFPPLQLDDRNKLTWDALFGAWEKLHKAKGGPEKIRKQWRSILARFAG